MEKRKNKFIEQRFVRDHIRPIFGLSNPTYLLDLNFRFVVWNASFHELFAKPLGLYIGMHVQNFVTKLENGKESIERAMRVFSVGSAPIVDSEMLIFNSEQFGKIEFQKLAVLISGKNGIPMSWVVCLNIYKAINLSELFVALTKRLEYETNWDFYSFSLDALMQNSATFKQAIKDLGTTKAIPNKSLFLGSTTGQEIIFYTEKNPNTEVTICEFSPAMKEKIQRSCRHKNIILLSQPADDLKCLLELTYDHIATFDGLHRTSNVPALLSEVKRVLQINGEFSFLTFHPKTDFAKMYKELNSESQSTGRRKDDHRSLQNFIEIFGRLSTNFIQLNHQQWKDYFDKLNLKIVISDDSQLWGHATLYRVIKIADQTN